MIVKFCVFAGRQKNMNILNQYIHVLLKRNIIQEYHLFDFTRNIQDKKNLQTYLQQTKFTGRIFLHNHEAEIQKSAQFDWSPFYKQISQEEFNHNSIIIKCDDDILFIDIHGLQNAIYDRMQDKKSFLIHSNCINNNICSYYHRSFFTNIQKELNEFPKGGILGPTFKNPCLAYNMHFEFCQHIMQGHSLSNFWIPTIYCNHRISINFILLRGEDCKYFKNTSLNDEYELSSYYPEKTLRPNKIIGNCLTSHFSYHHQHKILAKTNNLYILYEKVAQSYLSTISPPPLYDNVISNNVTIRQCGKNKFFVKNWVDDHYVLKCKDDYAWIRYHDSKITMHPKNKTYFQIRFFDQQIIEIHLGIYQLNPYQLMDDFTNRNILLKLLFHDQEKKIKLIPYKKKNQFYLQFVKSKLYISFHDQSLLLTQEQKTPISIVKIKKTRENIFVKRFIRNKKIFYKNLHNGHVFTNFYLGWGYENIMQIK